MEPVYRLKVAISAECSTARSLPSSVRLYRLKVAISAECSTANGGTMTGSAPPPQSRDIRGVFNFQTQT